MNRSASHRCESSIRTAKCSGCWRLPTLSKLLTTPGWTSSKSRRRNGRRFCRILDYGKFKYEQKRKSRQEHQEPPGSAQGNSRSPQDRRARHPVQDEAGPRLPRGKGQGQDLASCSVDAKTLTTIAAVRSSNGIITSLEDIAKIEKAPQMEGGRSMMAILTPNNEAAPAPSRCRAAAGGRLQLLALRRLRRGLL